MYIPIDVLFSFPSPNYDNPVKRDATGLVVVNAVFISIVVLAVSLRFYARIRLQRWFGWDDCLAGLAFLATIGYTVGIMLAYMRYHWDRHVWDIPFKAVPATLQIAFSNKLLFLTSISLTRISLICFYYRLVRNSGMRWFVNTLHASMAFNGIVFVVCILVTLLSCLPVSSYWTIPEPPGSRCMDDDKQTLALGIVNCVADLVVTLLPIPLVLRLQMPTRQRIGIAALLCLGFNVTIAGVVRTYFIYKGLFESWDTTWEAYGLWISATVEIDLAMICACAPAIRPLFTKTFLRSVSTFISSIVPPSLKVGSTARGTDNGTSTSAAAAAAAGGVAPASGKYRSLRSETDNATTSSPPFRESKSQITKTQTIEMSVVRQEEVDVSNQDRDAVDDGGGGGGSGKRVSMPQAARMKSWGTHH